MNKPRPLSTTEAAAIIGIAEGTLRIWRCQGKGPRFTKLGEAKQNSVTYAEADVQEWLEARKHASTSSYRPAGNPVPKIAQEPKRARQLLTESEREALTVQPWLRSSPGAK